jgi:hypothetical protein
MANYLHILHPLSVTELTHPNKSHTRATFSPHEKVWGVRTKPSLQDVIVEVTKVTHYIQRVDILTTRRFNFWKEFFEELEIPLTSRRHFLDEFCRSILVLCDSVVLAGCCKQL